MEMLHFSSKLAYLFPHNEEYVGNAIKVWKWIFSLENGRGLFTERNLISIGVLPELCCNSTSKDLSKKCYNSKLDATSYSQGLMLSSAANLYAFTEDKQYLNTGLMLLNAVLENYTTPSGLLIDEIRSGLTYTGQCQYNGDPGGDWYSFNGIFMLHLGYFTDIMTSKKALTDASLDRIKQFVQKTSDSAWNNSSVWPPFKNIDDVCNLNPNTNSTSPKFHWWWVKEETRQVMPPDISLYFRTNNLACVGNNTQLWQGQVANENVCQDKCAKNKNCSKYVISTSNNCWIWSYNRTDHTCNQTNSASLAGLKRPIGLASCKGRCGSNEPLEVENGLCYCDSACTEHLDCCLDYADECVKEKYLSCKGYCGDVKAQAIEGGGYCWCYNSCNPRFTDNNSLGSCCPDYAEQCLNITMPTCLDARSQGSALNLFLTHMKLSTL